MPTTLHSSLGARDFGPVGDEISHQLLTVLVHMQVTCEYLHKADTSGGDPYQVAVPDLRADGELLNERHRLFFVDYLRLCFSFGGFPG